MQSTELEHWTQAPPLPRVEVVKGVHLCPLVPIPFMEDLDISYRPHRREIRRIWLQEDALFWYIPKTRRRAMWNKIRQNYEAWFDWLTIDSTVSILRDMDKRRRRKAGLVVGVRGPKDGGKSVLASIIGTRIAEPKLVHVLFRYRDIKGHIRNIGDVDITAQIDEDLKSTGSESRTLWRHVTNAFETGRKADFNAICTGVNIDFSGWGDTLDFRFEPWGFNEEYQVTRAAVFDEQEEFLGFTAFQRKHLPDDPVYYYERLATWAEYKPRATAFSIEVLKSGGGIEGVDSDVQDRDIELLTQHIRLERLDKNLGLPTKKMARRFYRQAVKKYGITAGPSISYMDECIDWAYDTLEPLSTQGKEGEDGQRFSGLYKQITDSGWTGLRKDLEELTDRAFAFYHVPTHPRASYGDIVEELEIVGLLPDSLGKRIRQRRRLLKPSELGLIGERAMKSWLDSPARCGSGAKGSPDVLLHPDEDEIAINVKLTLKEHFKESLEVTPEHQWMPRALVALLLPRQLQVRLFPIAGPIMTVNWKRGVLATPDTIGQTIKEMIENV